MADQQDKNIPPQPESSANKYEGQPQGGPKKPSQAEGDEETIDKALDNQEKQSK